MSACRDDLRGACNYLDRECQIPRNVTSVCQLRVRGSSPKPTRVPNRILTILLSGNDGVIKSIREKNGTKPGIKEYMNIATRAI